MFVHGYGYSSSLWENFYSHEWESIPWSTSRQSSSWPSGSVCPQHMVFPSRGTATAGTEQQGTRSCPGWGSQRIHSKTPLQETKSESMGSLNHICVLLRMPNPDMLLEIYSKCTQIELSLFHMVVLQWGWNITRVYHLSLLFLHLLHNGCLVESIWFT